MSQLMILFLSIVILVISFIIYDLYTRISKANKKLEILKSNIETIDIEVTSIFSKVFDKSLEESIEKVQTNLNQIQRQIRRLF